MSGEYVIPPDLAYVVDPSEDEPLRVFLLQLPHGKPLALVGVSAIIWLLAIDGETDLVPLVAEATGQQPADIDVAVRDYLDDLLRTGLLSRKS